MKVAQCAATAIYKNGVHYKWIQGDEYTSPLYEPGTDVTIRRQGNLLSTSLYYGGTQRTFNLRGAATTRSLYTTSSVYVTKQGSAVPRELYYKSSSGAYIPFGETVYYAGSSATYYTRSLYASAGELYESGGSTTVYVRGEEYTSPLYEPGSSVTIRQQGNLLKTALYHAGTEYPNGLYTNIELAEIKTRDITALTA